MRETEETFLEQGEKRRRRTGEERYEEKVNKKVNEQRKQKPEKKHKGERIQMVKGQKEKRRREELPGE
jgi:hypothetical protein